MWMNSLCVSLNWEFSLKPQCCVVVSFPPSTLCHAVCCVSSGDPEGPARLWSPHHRTGDSGLIQSEQQVSVWEAVCWVETTAHGSEGKKGQSFKWSLFFFFAYKRRHIIKVAPDIFFILTWLCDGLRYSHHPRIRFSDLCCVFQVMFWFYGLQLNCCFVQLH